MAIADAHHACEVQSFGPDRVPDEIGSPARDYWLGFDCPIRFGGKWIFMIAIPADGTEAAIPVRFCPWCGVN